MQVKGQDDKKFRLKSQATKYLAEEGLSKAKLVQLETAFEVQIKLKDGDGNIVTRSATHDTYEQAKKWADEEEAKILQFKKANGSFDSTYESMTVAQALQKFHAKHYRGKSSFKENGYRVEHLIDWLQGDKTLFRDITKKRLQSLRDQLEGMEYSESSIRNYFTVLNSLYKHAISEWNYPITNAVTGIKLDKPNNEIQRYWEGNERERLFDSIRKHRPWLEDIVNMSLEMSFRRGELVAGAKDKKTGKQEPGLVWEGVNFEKGTVRLFTEKNDWKKANTELKGRTVPMTDKMREILLRHYDKHPTKKGPVFLTYRLNGDHTPTTINTVSHAFTEVCRQAEPPIEGLTFHSCRKIATTDIGLKVPNAIVLGKLTGHRSINVLAHRYYTLQMDDAKQYLGIGLSDNIVERGITLLEKYFTTEQVAEFLSEVRKLGDVKEVIEPTDEVDKAPTLLPEEKTSNEEDVADTILEAWTKKA